MAQQLVALIDACATTNDPFQCITNGIETSFLPVGRSSFWTSLIICGILIAIAFILAGLGLVARALRGKSALWLFRWKWTPHGHLLIPNATLLFTITIFVFSAVAEAFAWVIQAVYRYHRDILQLGRLQGVTKGLAGSLLFTSVWFLAWGMSAATFLNSCQRASRRHLSAWTLNLFYGFGLVAFWATVLPLFEVAASRFQDAFDIYLEVAQSISQSAATWDGKSRPELTLQTLLLLEQLQVALSSSFRIAIQRACLPLCIFVSVLAAAFTFSGALYVIMLRRNLYHLAQYIPAGQVSKMAPKAFFGRESHRAYFLLGLSLSCNLLISIGYALLSGWTLVDFDYVTATPVGVELIYTLPLYFFGFLGVPPIAIMFHKAMTSLSAHYRQTKAAASKSDARHIIQGVKISQEVYIEVDFEKWETESDELELFDKLHVSTLTPEDAAMIAARASMAACLAPF